VGPGLGALVAVGFYRFVKVLEYETANPGADFNEKEAKVFKFDEDNTATMAEVERPNVAVQPTPKDLEEGNSGVMKQNSSLSHDGTSSPEQDESGAIGSREPETS